MSLSTNRRVILAKIESSYNTDPTPTGTDNAMLIRNLTATPLDAELVSREVIRDYFGNSDTLLAQSNSRVEFEIELAGAGTPGVAPGWAPLLRACAFAESAKTSAVTIASSTTTATVTETSHGRSTGSYVKISGATETEYNGTFAITVLDANSYTYTMLSDPTGSAATGSPVVGTRVEYLPISSSLESVTIYFNNSGVLHKMTGCRGTVSFDINVKQIPVMKFSFTGNYVAPTDTALPTTDFTDFQIPKVANTSNTTSFSLHSYAGYLEQMTLDVANQVEARQLIGYEAVEIVDRKPAGTFLIEAPLIASKDYFSIARAGTTGALTITHGTVNGNIVKIDSPRVSIGNPSYQDSQGVQMLSIPFVASPDDGNDEIVINVS